MVRFGSVCSGIEAASVAWHPLGWQAAWLAEIEPFPSAVLRHHYPDVPNHGDMTQLPDLIRSGEVEAPDLFCGGTPCQAFSVAGLRRSLDDARGNLSLTFCEIANAIDDVRRARGDDECIVLWENVPGVLSTQDNAFGCFLSALAGCDTTIDPLAATGWTNAGVVAGPQRTVAWRVLDAQYFGVAQRRRRVFVVASSRDGFDPAAVLFEFDGVRRDTAPSREAGKVAPTIPSRSTAGGGLGTDFDCDGGVITMAHGQGGAEIGFDRGPTLTCNHEAPIAAYSIMPMNSGKDYKARQVEVAQPLMAGGPVGGNQGGDFILQSVTHSLRGEGFDASEDGTGRGTLLVPVAGSICAHSFIGGAGGRPEGAAAGHFVPVAFHPTQDPISSTDVCHAIGTGSGQGCATAAVDVDTYNHTITGDYTGSLTTTGGPPLSGPGVLQAMQVRRLTPTECERLQGFPDGYTQIPWRKKPANQCPDGPRYKALGNSWAVPVVRWIGSRINAMLEHQ
jgi:DNA (cytosine-5)-methyltransferase 1